VAKYYMLRRPTGQARWDYFLLYVGAKLKKFYVGTYYIPKYRVLAPVFKPSPGTPLDLRALVEVPSDILENSYRMICIECGWCCERDSGAFALENEVRDLPLHLVDRPLDWKWVDTVIGPVKVYRLDLGPGGRCVFYSDGRCLVPRDRKPIICLIHYCSLYAEMRGRKFIKVGVRRVGGQYEPIYREVSDEEFELIKNRVLSRRRGSR